MKIVSVAILKAKISHYLGLVQNGEEVIVTSHRQPVARILSTEASSLQPRLPSRSPHDLRKLKGIKRRTSISAVQSLIEDRRNR